MNLGFNILGRRSGGGAQAFDSPAPLQVMPISTTRIDSWWLDVGQDNNKLYIDDVLVYDGTNLTYSATGLTRGQSYVFKLVVSLDGQESVELTKTVSTIPVDVLAWFEFTGLEYNTDNAYGTMDGTLPYRINAFKSVFGPSHIASNVNTNRSDINYRPKHSAYHSFRGATAGYVLDTPIILSGDWTVLAPENEIAEYSAVARILGTNTGFSNTLMVKITSGQVSVRLTINSVLYIVDIATSKVIGDTISIAWRKKGTNYYASIDGGSTWSPPVTVANLDVTINNLLANPAGSYSWTNQTGPRFVFLQGADYTIDELAHANDYFKLSDYTPETPSGTLVAKGLTFEALVNGHIANTMAWGFNSGNKNFDRLKSSMNLHFFALNADPTAPTYSSGLSYVYDSKTHKISNEIDLGYYVASTDVHANNSVDIFDKTVDYLRPNVFYGLVSTYSTFKRKSSGKNFNFTKINERIYASNIAKNICDHTTYYQCVNIGSRRCLIVQEQGDAGQSVGQYITIFYSDDNFNSHRKIRLMAAGPNIGAVDQWLYFRIAEGVDSVYIYWQRLANSNPDRVTELGVIKSNDGITWTNKDGSWSKNVDSAGTITISEAIANTIIFDASALVGEAALISGYVDENGLPYCILTNGLNTGFYLWNNGTLKTIDFKGYTTSFDPTQAGMECVKTGASAFHLFFRETTNANGRCAHIKTIDGGDNWTDEGLVNDDAAINYGQIFISKNHHFNSDAIMMVGIAGSPLYKGSITEIKLNGSYTI